MERFLPSFRGSIVATEFWRGLRKSRPMELDLWIAIGFIAAISGLALIAGRRLSLSVYRNRPLLFAECLVLSLVFAFGLSNRLSDIGAASFGRAFDV